MFGAYTFASSTFGGYSFVSFSDEAVAIRSLRAVVLSSRPHATVLRTSASR